MRPQRCGTIYHQGAALKVPVRKPRDVPPGEAPSRQRSWTCDRLLSAQETPHASDLKMAKSGGRDHSACHWRRAEFLGHLRDLCGFRVLLDEPLLPHLRDEHLDRKFAQRPPPVGAQRRESKSARATALGLAEDLFLAL